MVKIRREQASDIEAIREINNFAFGQPDEGLIIDRLRENCNEMLSLVTLIDNKTVGHILFSPVTFEGRAKTVQGIGLAPMAVLPEFQRQGIGSRLAIEGIEAIRRSGYPFIIVIGHEKYYPRFGFERASKYDFTRQWEDVPDDAFMVLILNHNDIRDVSGVVKYRDEFSAAM
jgi:putative acetyltransferase